MYGTVEAGKKGDVRNGVRCVVGEEFRECDVIREMMDSQRRIGVRRSARLMLRRNRTVDCHSWLRRCGHGIWEGLYTKKSKTMCFEET